MTRVWVADLEANGLLDEATVIHCGVFKDMESRRVVKFTPSTIKEIPAFIEANVDMLIGHNFLGYDIPLMKKVLNYEYTGKVFDTLVISRLLNPNRRTPSNCLNAGASPHGLESWGYRVGRGKPEHDDWSVYSPKMLHRCSEDVEINELVYYALQQEGLDSPGDWNKAIPMTNALFKVFKRIEEYGWKVDQEWMQTCITTLNAEFHTIDNYLNPLLSYVREDNGVVNKPFKKDGKYSAVMVKWFLDTSDSSYEAIDREYDREVGGPFCRILYRKVDVTKRVEMINLLLEQGWVPDEWNFNKETKERTSPKLSYKDDFVGITSDMGKMAAKRVQVRHRHSLIKGLFKLIRPDGRIGSRVTGLADTSRVKHSGIVNIPNGHSYFGKEIRKIFIADDDLTMVGIDSKSNQARQLTAIMGDDEYEYTVLHEDIHERNRIAAGLKTRDQSKIFFYGFLFGTGDAKTGTIVGGTAKDGKRLKSQFLDELPLLKDLVKNLTDTWRGTAMSRYNQKWHRMEWYNGWLPGLDGRPLFIKTEHAILVYVLQNMEAVHMSYALLFFYNWLCEKYEWGVDVGISIFYHDEFNVECKPEIAEDVGRLGAEAIAHAGRYLGIKTPHEGDVQIGNNWFDIHGDKKNESKTQSTKTD